MEKVIGVVSELNGSVVAVQPGGATRQLAIGSDIYEGDTIETDDIGALTITFNDQTSFSIGQDSAIVIDEYIYDPSTNDGSHKFSALKGLFVFVSGLLADDHPEDIAIATPVGTIGIRGTVITGSIGAESTDAGVQITFVQGAGFLDSGVAGIVNLAGTFASVRIENEQVRTFVLEGEDLESFVTSLGEAGVRALQTAAPEVDWATIMPVVTTGDANPDADASDNQPDSAEPDATNSLSPPEPNTLPSAPAPDPAPTNSDSQPPAPDDQANSSPPTEPTSSPALSPSITSLTTAIGHASSTPATSTRETNKPSATPVVDQPTQQGSEQSPAPLRPIENPEQTAPPEKTSVDPGPPEDRGPPDRAPVNPAPPEDRGPPDREPVDPGPPEDRGPPDRAPVNPAPPVDQGPPGLIDLPTFQPPADPPILIALPQLQLLNDTGASNNDGISSTGIVSITGLNGQVIWEYSVDGGSTWAAAGAENRLFGDGYFLPPGVIALDESVSSASVAFQKGGPGSSMHVTDDAGQAYLTVRNPTDQPVEYRWDHNTGEAGKFIAIPGLSLVPVSIPTGGSTRFFDQSDTQVGQGTRSSNPNTAPQTATTTRDSIAWGFDVPPREYGANAIRIRLDGDTSKTYGLNAPITIDQTPPTTLTVDELSSSHLAGQTDGQFVVYHITDDTGTATLYESDTTPVDTNGRWSLAGDPALLGPGDYMATIRSADLAGNELSINRTLSIGTAADDTISADTGTEGSLLFGKNGEDTLYGGDGNDYLDGGAGNDMLDPGTGDDTMHGGPGDDHLYLNEAAPGTQIDGGDGEDTLIITFSEEPLDFLFASPGADGKAPASNIEQIDLQGQHQLVLQLDDVIQITDNRNTLTISYDAGSSITPPSEMVEVMSIETDGYRTTSYSYIPDADSDLAGSLDSLSIELHLVTPLV